MFTISAKGAYGLYAMIELAKRYRSGSVQIKDIAETQSIPQHYLEQLLVTLRKAGFVKSFRGTNGGYCLAKSPAEILLVDIFVALEGPVEILREQVPRGGLEFFWDNLERQFGQALQQSLDGIVQEIEKQKSSFVYTI